MTTDEDHPARHWFALLLPALTFLVGLGLGGVLVFAATGGSDGPEAAPAPPTTTASAGRGAGDTVVTLPAACQDAATQITEAYGLLQQAVSQVRDFQPGPLVETLNQLEDVDATTRPLVSECSAVSVTSSPTPTATPTGIPTSTPVPSTEPSTEPSPAEASPTS